jgi:hypothetical protein
MTELQGEILIGLVSGVSDNIVAYVGPLLDVLFRLADLSVAIVWLVAFIVGWSFAGTFSPPSLWGRERS